MLLVSPAFGIGYDYEPGQHLKKDYWPSGLQDVIHSQAWVSGCWLNGSDRFFYTGDQTRLHDMLAALADATDVKTDVVLHPGPGTATTAYGVKSLGRADWAVTAYNPSSFGNPDHQVRVDIWLGHTVTLDGLEIPQRFSLRAGNEIQEFVDKHNSVRAD